MTPDHRHHADDPGAHPRVALPPGVTAAHRAGGDLEARPGANDPGVLPHGERHPEARPGELGTIQMAARKQRKVDLVWTDTGLIEEEGRAQTRLLGANTIDHVVVTIVIDDAFKVHLQQKG